ncbi:MAG: hypothetical protein IAG13_21550 [Deltaproteobacteria bacterium]|nr:hypothetical protein [Nannocystaceae bacterium]
MTTPQALRPLPLLLACALAPACFEEPVTAAEARTAVDDVVATGQAVSVQDGIVEITTSFTLADGLRDAAQQVRAFVESQISCSTVSSPAENTLVIDFGTLDDECSFEGRTFAGVVTLEFEPGEEQVVITHAYDGLTDGKAALDGSATVTWTERARHIVTDLAFSNARGQFTATSDRTQTRIGARGEGLTVEGVRDWQGPRGDWHLDIDDVELRAVDPVPQDGAYAVTLPNGKQITMSFERIDADTIEVRIAGGRRDRIFRVSSAGDVDG